MNNRNMIAAAVVAAIALLTWSFSNVFVSQASRECTRLYSAARTAADSSGIDSIVPAGTYQTTEPRSCGSFRGAARWVAHP